MPIIQADEDSDMYGGGDGGADDSPKQDKALAEDMETAILPKSILLGREINPGDKVILKVLEIGDEDFTVNYSTDKDDDKKDKGDDDDKGDSDDKDDDGDHEIVLEESGIVEDDMDAMFAG